MPEIWPGSPYPLGATWDGSGTNFAVFSEHAESMELCFFDADGNETLIPLQEQSAFVFHGYVPGIGPGQLYGYRAHGRWDPERGFHFNPAKLLLDPYAQAVDGAPTYDRSIYAYSDGSPHIADPTDSAPSMAKSVVVNPYFDWGNDRRPKRPRRDTLVYEAHVKGFTALHPMIPEDIRGTYAGIAHPVVIDYLRSLGVTALELLPVHQHFSEQFLVDRGLTNYWGYSSIGYLAPHNGYSAWGQNGEQVQEFKHMVRSLHQGGIEVILDVVYNHTCEGGPLGPTLCHRGLDNLSYYRIDPDNPSQYVDYTGTGNTLDVSHPNTLQMIMDSLRYWVNEMHVDGFRFDLAATLGRDSHHVDAAAAFFDIIHQDPVLRQVKLIAEPWDVGEGGYQVGRFPPLWSEWNGDYRDTVRDFWRGEPGQLGPMASRFTGSSDLYQMNGRRPSASVNFVTAHDGFTLRDLVSFNHRHNFANTEDNRDGESHNRSWNSGAEGETDDVDVNDTRGRRSRAILTTMLLSQGVPMLMAGDERGRSQGGNNNAYCQDTELSWMDWDSFDDELLAFTQRVIALRKEHAVFRRRRFFSGRTGETKHAHDSNHDAQHRRLPDIGWYQASGDRMDDAAWHDAGSRQLSVFLNGDELADRGSRGEPIHGESFVVFFNASNDSNDFHIAEELTSRWWLVELDSGDPKPSGVPVVGGMTVGPWSVVVLREDKR